MSRAARRAAARTLQAVGYLLGRIQTPHATWTLVDGQRPRFVRDGGWRWASCDLSVALLSIGLYLDDEDTEEVTS